MPTSRSYHSYLIEALKDPQEAIAYRDAVLEDWTDDELRLAFRNIAEARLLVLCHSSVSPNLEMHRKLDLTSLITTSLQGIM